MGQVSRMLLINSAIAWRWILNLTKIKTDCLTWHIKKTENFSWDDNWLTLAESSYTILLLQINNTYGTIFSYKIHIYFWNTTYLKETYFNKKINIKLGWKTKTKVLTLLHHLFSEKCNIFGNFHLVCLSEKRNKQPAHVFMWRDQGTRRNTD